MKTRRHQINDRIGIYTSPTIQIDVKDTLAVIQATEVTAVELPLGRYDEQIISVTERLGYNATLTAAGGKTIGGQASIILNKTSLTVMWDDDTDEWYILHGHTHTNRAELDQIDQTKVDNSSVAHWVGTQAEYDAIVTKDPLTVYLVEEEE